MRLRPFLLLFCGIWMLSAPAHAEKAVFTPYKEAATAVAADAKDADAISPEELKKMRDAGSPVRIWDARAQSEYRHERIAGSFLSRSEEFYRQEQLFKDGVIKTRPDAGHYLEVSTQGIPKDTAIVTYCNRHCGISKNLMNDLRRLGFTRVRYLTDGIDGWKDKGYPVEQG